MNWKGTYPSHWTQGVIDVKEADCILHRTGHEGRVDASCLDHDCGLLFVCDRWELVFTGQLDCFV